MLQKTNIVFKLVAITLVIAFLWQGIVWAYPDIASKTTLAPQGLATSEDKAASFERFAIQYLKTKLGKNPQSHTLITFKAEWWPAIWAAALKRGLKDAERPKIKSDKSSLDEGLIKIQFPNKHELIFYNPNLEDTLKQIREESEGKKYEEIQVNKYLHVRFSKGIDFLEPPEGPKERDLAAPPSLAEPRERRFGKVSSPKQRKKGYRYYMIQGGRTRYFHFRWNIFASLEDQIMGNIEEREWLIEAAKDIKEIQDIFAAVKGIKAKISAKDKEKIQAILKQILDVINSPYVRLPDKQHAAGCIKTAKASYDKGTLEDLRESWANLRDARKDLNKRKEEVERIYKRLRDILGYARSWAEEMNTYMAKVAKSRTTKSLHSLANRDEIKAPENEPEFEGLEPLIREAIRNPKKRNANLKKVEEEIKTASFLSRAVAEFKDAYFDSRYMGWDESYKKKLFQDNWLKYLKASDIVRGSPAYWYARFYQAAFVHRTIPNPERPSERISNPLFEASAALIQMLKIGRFNSILTTRSLLPKKSFPETRGLIEGFKDRKKKGGGKKKSLYDLSKKERRDLVREVARDKNLSRANLITLNKCAEVFYSTSPQSRNGGFVRKRTLIGTVIVLVIAALANTAFGGVLEDLGAGPDSHYYLLPIAAIVSTAVLIVISWKRLRDIRQSAHALRYHFRIDSIIRSYKKAVLLMPEQSIYKTGPGEEEPEVIALRHPDYEKNQKRIEKIKKAIEILREKGFAERADKLENVTTILGLTNIKTYLLFSDPGRGIFRAIHPGRRRNVLYMSMRFLDNFHLERHDDMEILAALLNKEQRFLDAYNLLNRQEASPRRMHALLQEERKTTVDEKEKSICPPDKIETRLKELDKKDAEILRNEIEPSLRREENAADSLKIALRKDWGDWADELQAVEFRDDYTELANKYHIISYRHEGLGKRGKTQQFYRKSIEIFKLAQKFDRGLWPIEVQEQITYMFLREGMYKEFLSELKGLLTGEGFPRPLEKDEQVLREGFLFAHFNYLKREILYILASHESIATSWQRPKIDRIRRKAALLFDEYSDIKAQSLPAQERKGPFFRLALWLINFHRDNRGAIEISLDLSGPLSEYTPRELGSMFPELPELWFGKISLKTWQALTDREKGLIIYLAGIRGFMKPKLLTEIAAILKILPKNVKKEYAPISEKIKGVARTEKAVSIIARSRICTHRAIADRLGIVRSTLWIWMNQYPAIRKAYEKRVREIAKEKRESRLRRKKAQAAKKRKKRKEQTELLSDGFRETAKALTKETIANPLSKTTFINLVAERLGLRVSDVNRFLKMKKIELKNYRRQLERKVVIDEFKNTFAKNPHSRFLKVARALGFNSNEDLWLTIFDLGLRKEIGRLDRELEENPQVAAPAAGPVKLVYTKNASETTLLLEDSLPKKGKKVTIPVWHPDDDVIQIGMTIKELVDRGCEVTIVYFTSGAHAVTDEYMEKMGRWSSNKKELMREKIAIRKEETRKALEKLGVLGRVRLEFLDLPFYYRRATKGLD
ncbi:MAG: PIG-L family deacetylase, partial [Candidatus Omnitrophota bacterium]